jgi:hypothetical protein
MRFAIDQHRSLDALEHARTLLTTLEGAIGLTDEDIAGDIAETVLALGATATSEIATWPDKSRAAVESAASKLTPRDDAERLRTVVARCVFHRAELDVSVTVRSNGVVEAQTVPALDVAPCIAFEASAYFAGATASVKAHVVVRE